MEEERAVLVTTKRSGEEATSSYSISFGEAAKSQNKRSSDQKRIQELDADLLLVTGY